MAIQELEVWGYRSFREITRRPGRLNLLVGPNGSGKSKFQIEESEWPPAWDMPPSGIWTL